MLDSKKIWSSSQLPTLPGVAAKLLELTKDPETEIRQVIDVISTDPAISAKLLKAANSSFFGLSSEVRTIDRAVPLLGTTVATSLALSFSLTDDAMSRGPVADHYQSYWRQSIVQACAAEVLARRKHKAQAGEFFLCGLLLDLGRLAMLKTIPKQYVPVLESTATQLRPLTDCENESFGFCHVEIGAKLMENWKLPQLMVDAMRFHHAPLSRLEEHRGDVHFPLMASMVAAAAVGDYACTSLKGPALERLRQVTQDHFEMSPDSLDEFLKHVDERFKLAGDLFKIDMTDIGSPSDLMLEANEQLAQLAMKEHLASTQAAAKQQSAEAEVRVLENKNVQLQEQALHDPLTKLYNRHFFDETLDREFKRCIRTASPVGIIFVDVDYFKRLNDTYGHQSGDDVLQRIAAILKEAVRNSDTVGRFGGEEFVILVSQPSEKGIEKFADRIRERIASEPFTIKGERVQVTASFGAAVMVPGRLAQEPQKELIAVADACLYESKQNGRNRVTARSLIGEEERRLMLKVSHQRFSRWLVSQNLLQIPAVSKALLECQPLNKRIGELAMQHALLTEEQVKFVLSIQQDSGCRFGKIACQKGWLDEQQLSQLLAWQQEDPKQLATVLIRQGLLAPEIAAAALENYHRSFAAAPQAVLV